MSDTNAFCGLEPGGLWRHFEAITRIPRPSGHEEKMVEYVASWADAHGFPAVRDATGNICVQVPGRPPYENAPAVVLQSHLDMVCERNSDTPYDTSVGRMHVVREDDWLRAEGTTLGADNGIGCAAMLYVAELPDVPRGPLDLLFTLDEERGLVGATNLDASIIRGQTLLNLDSEDDGTLVVGCSGGCGSSLRWTGEREPMPPGWVQMQISVSGLRGGHSGLDIDKGRLNALRAMVRILQNARKSVPLRLVALHGGEKTNAIPRECRATVCVASALGVQLQKELNESAATLVTQYRGREDRLTVGLDPVPRGDAAEPFSEEGTGRLLDLLSAIPCGLLAITPEIPGLVETSNNVGVVRTSGSEVEIRCSSRSSVPGSLRELLDTLHVLARLGGAAIQEGDGYPGWKPDLDSHVLGVARKSYQRLYGEDPVVTAIHAGLECGLIGQRLPGMDMLSLGPDIKGVHAPNERVRISSVQRFCDFLAAIVQDLAVESGSSGVARGAL